MANGAEIYRVEIGDQRFRFEAIIIDDPVPTGRQLLDAAGLFPVQDHLIFQLHENRALDELRLDETVDLRPNVTERFIAFRADRSYRFILDDRRYEWGATSILGTVLKELAGVDPDTHGVWLERTDEPDLPIGDDEAAGLTEVGVERFRSGPVFLLCIEDGIYPWPRSTITTEEIARVGGWDPSIGVIEVDEHQNERTLAPGEVVELKPGNSYGKKLRWKRG